VVSFLQVPLLKACMPVFSLPYVLQHRPSPSLFDHPNYIWRRVQIIKLLVMQSSPLPCYLVPLSLSTPYRTPANNTNQQCSRARARTHTRTTFLVPLLQETKLSSESCNSPPSFSFCAIDKVRTVWTLVTFICKY
jgi:hypothetical protein